MTAKGTKIPKWAVESAVKVVHPNLTPLQYQQEVARFMECSDEYMQADYDRLHCVATEFVTAGREQRIRCADKVLAVARMNKPFASAGSFISSILRCMDDDPDYVFTGDPDE